MKWRRVALLGFAYRHISVKFTQKTKKPSQPKPLPVKAKTIADWIQVKLRENGMSPFHLGAKMGIATSVVNAWKDGLARPQNRQMREMVSILGTHRHGRSGVIAVGLC
jgi:ribosome-binding protein aMBF1 (putative translation factor)